MTILPLAPDQTIAQMWSNGARGVMEAEMFINHRNYQKHMQHLRPMVETTSSS